MAALRYMLTEMVFCGMPNTHALVNKKPIKQQKSLSFIYREDFHVNRATYIQTFGEVLLLLLHTG